MSRRDDERELHEKQIDRVIMEAGQEIGGPDEPRDRIDVAPDRARGHRSANLSRARMSWAPADELVMITIRQRAEETIRREFAPAYELMAEVWAYVREPEVDESTGEIQKDGFGSIIWRKGISGRPLEDWNRVGPLLRESLIFRSISVLAELEPVAADFWGESMFAKAAWEQAFAQGYDSGDGKLTIEDRTARGRLSSMEDRYFSIFLSWLSRRADAVLSTVRLLNQRLKDISS